MKGKKREVSLDSLSLGLGPKKCYRAVSVPKTWEYAQSSSVLHVSNSTWGATLVEICTKYVLIQGVIY